MCRGHVVHVVQRPTLSPGQQVIPFSSASMAAQVAHPGYRQYLCAHLAPATRAEPFATHRLAQAAALSSARRGVSSLKPGRLSGRSEKSAPVRGRPRRASRHRTHR